MTSDPALVTGGVWTWACTAFVGDVITRGVLLICDESEAFPGKFLGGNNG
jgi:hypothetical protein